MSSNYITNAINIKSYNLSESDRIVLMYSREKGLLRGVAKGSKKPKSKLARFFGQFADVMIVILFVAAMISIVVAIIEKEYTEMVDGFIIFAIVLLNAVIGFVQEMKAEKCHPMCLKMTPSHTQTKTLRVTSPSLLTA